MKEKLPRKLQKKFKKAWGPREVVMKEILKRSTMFRNSLDQEEKQKITDELNEILEKPENKKKLRKVLDAFTALQCLLLRVLHPFQSLTNELHNRL